jgi:hypothetical protein
MHLYFTSRIQTPSVTSTNESPFGELTSVSGKIVAHVTMRQHADQSFGPPLFLMVLKTSTFVSSVTYIVVDA